MPAALARLLSYLLHPLLMPFYAALMVMNLNSYVAYSISPQVQRIIVSLVFITTCILPVLTALILLQKGMIRSLEMESLAERKIPFVTTALFYCICFYLLNQLPVPRILSWMVLGATITIIIAWLFSFFWKISIHMIGIGGFAGILLGLSQVLNTSLSGILLLSIIVAGLLGTARLTLGAHSPKQVYAGFLLGLSTEWIAITWLTS
jgi:membrane-associated phospholipid phosphatase